MADPITRAFQIEAFRDRLTDMHQRVGMVFFMPQTRERFRDKLYRKRVKLGQQRSMLLATIDSAPALKAEYRRRVAERAREADTPNAAPAATSDTTAESTTSPRRPHPLPELPDSKHTALSSVTDKVGVTLGAVTTRARNRATERDR